MKSFIVNELKERILKTELHQVLENGPGVFVVRNLYEGEVIDQSNTIFEKIVEGFLEEFCEEEVFEKVF